MIFSGEKALERTKRDRAVDENCRSPALRQRPVGSLGVCENLPVRVSRRLWLPRQIEVKTIFGREALLARCLESGLGRGCLSSSALR